MGEEHSNTHINIFVLCIVITLAAAIAFSVKRREQINAENAYKAEVIKTIETAFNEESKSKGDDLSIRYSFYMETDIGIDIYYNVYKDDYLRGKIDVTMSNWDGDDFKVYKEWIY